MDSGRTTFKYCIFFCGADCEEMELEIFTIDENQVVCINQQNPKYCYMQRKNKLQITSMSYMYDPEVYKPYHFDCRSHATTRMALRKL